MISIDNIAKIENININTNKIFFNYTYFYILYICINIIISGISSKYILNEKKFLGIFLNNISIIIFSMIDLIVNKKSQFQYFIPLILYILLFSIFNLLFFKTLKLEQKLYFNFYIQLNFVYCCFFFFIDFDKFINVDIINTVNNYIKTNITDKINNNINKVNNEIEKNNILYNNYNNEISDKYNTSNNKIFINDAISQLNTLESNLTSLYNNIETINVNTENIYNNQEISYNNLSNLNNNIFQLLELKNINESLYYEYIDKTPGINFISLYDEYLKNIDSSIYLKLIQILKSKFLYDDNLINNINTYLTYLKTIKDNLKTFDFTSLKYINTFNNNFNYICTSQLTIDENILLCIHKDFSQNTNFIKLFKDESILNILPNITLSNITISNNITLKRIIRNNIFIGLDISILYNNITYDVILIKSFNKIYVLFFENNKFKFIISNSCWLLSIFSDNTYSIFDYFESNMYNITNISNLNFNFFSINGNLFSNGFQLKEIIDIKNTFSNLLNNSNISIYESINNESFNIDLNFNNINFFIKFNTNLDSCVIEFLSNTVTLSSYILSSNLFSNISINNYFN